MLRNFFKVTWRNIRRSKLFSFINIVGLAIGMASALLIFLWIENEISYDRFYPNVSRIYTLCNRDHFNGALWAWQTTPKVLAPTVRRSFPEVEEAVRQTDLTFLLRVGDKRLNVSGNAVDSGFFNMFSFPLLNGQPTTTLTTEHSIVLTEKLARKLFGDEDAMGKTIRVDSVDLMTVTGVMKDLPNNTTFDFEFLVPWSYLHKIGHDDNNWGNNSVTSMVMLRPGTSQAAFDEKIRRISIEHSGTDNITTEVFTQPLRDRWLYSRSDNGKFVAGRVTTVRLFAIIACFILLIACINFMNLSTARSEKRAKEVGIRKVAGAEKSLLIAQFLGESVFLALISGVIAVVLVEIFLGSFNTLVTKQLFINFLQPGFWIFFFGFVLFTGIIAGSYPAFFLSSFQPIQVLKGTFRPAKALITPRKFLVVLQFTFAIVLIICTLIVKDQINYAQNRDAGYSKDRLVFSELSGEIEKHYDLIRNELLSSGAAIAVTKSMSPITQRYSDSWGFKWDGSVSTDEKTDFVRMSSDADFCKTMGIKLLQGRDIDIRNFPGDSTAMLVNQTAVKVMRLKNPVGTTVEYDSLKWRVVGVVEDFIYESPFAKVQQLIVSGPKSWYNTMHYKLNPAKPVAEDLRLAETVFRKYNPEYPYEYHFADEAYAKKFRNEQRTATLAALFAGLTIFISCLGLFGLATYIAETRIKEIGVRKVLGASVLSITNLLSREVLGLVAISIVVASPIAWFFMHSWLQDFEYRISIGAGVFLFSGLSALVIAFATVSYQAIRAAVSNPVKSLRTE